MISRKSELSLLALILALSLSLRIYALDVFLTPDEHNWSARSRSFHTALMGGEWAGTFCSTHPGVLTMWAGTTVIALEPGYDWANADTLFIFRGRRVVAVLSWLALIPIWLLVRRLWGRKESLIGLSLVALEPFLLAHCRFLHVDALTALTMTLSLLSLALYIARQGPVWTIPLSGTVAGLAALNKSSALFLVPFAGLVLAYRAWQRWGVSLKGLEVLVRDGLLWGLALATAFCLLWPAMWVAPVQTLQRVIHGALYYAATPHENANFFWGQRRLDPGAAFYPVALLFRLTPLTLLGLVGWLYAWRSRRAHTADGLLLGFCLSFAAFMTMGAKKFDRYLLPVFPPLDLIAGLGMVNTGRRLLQRQTLISHQRWLSGVGLILLALLQMAILLPHHPYYLTYYNPLLGGGRRAAQRLLVGWGEGLDQAAAWFNQQPQAERLTVATVPYDSIMLGRFFGGRLVEFSQMDLTTDYFVFYINLIQRDPQGPRNTAGAVDPVQTITLNGIEYVYIYPASEYLGPVVAYLDQNTGSGDVVVLSDYAPFLSSQLRVPSISPAADLTVAEAGAQLAEATAARDRVWYVYTDAAIENQSSVFYQLSTRCVRLSDVAIASLGRVAAYRLPPAPSFGMTPIERATAVDFQDALKLMGYGGLSRSVDSNQAVDLALRWRTPCPLEDNYSLALRLVDDQGHVWGSLDQWLLNEAREPTAAWSPHDVQVTFHSLPLIFGAPPGEYTLHLIVYRLEQDQAIDLLDACSGEIPTVGPVVNLGPVRVRASSVLPEAPGWHVPHPMIRDLGGGVRLLGTDHLPEKIAPGTRLALTLFWQAQRDRLPDCDLWLALEPVAGGEAQIYRMPPTGPAYPTSHWRREEYLRSQVSLLLPATLPLGEYRLLMNLAPVGGHGFLAPEPVELGVFSVEGRAHLFEKPRINHGQRVQLGAAIAFLGYDLLQTEVTAGGTLPFTLYWQASGPTEVAYKVFTHLLDANSQLWGQWDSQPQQGQAPTTSWVEEEIIVDRYEIPVDGDAPPGLYRIEVGMYDPTNGQRLPVFDEVAQSVMSDRVLLDTPIRLYEP